MINYIFTIIISLIVVLLPIIGLAGSIFLVNANKERPIGFLHYLPWLLVVVMAVDVLFSGRSLNNESLILHNDTARSAIPANVIRICTVLIIAASLERILNFITIYKKPFGQNAFLTITFSVFWLGSVGLSSVLSFHTNFSHEYLYCLIIGLGLLSQTKNESLLFMISLRNSIFLFIVSSLVCTILKPELVIQTNYSQGLINGLPRLAGLAPHAVVFGVLSLILLVVTIKFPFKSSTLQKISIFLTLAALFMAQSKTVWVTTLQVSLVIFYYSIKSRVQGEPLLRSQIVLSLIVTLFFIANMGLIFSVLGGLISKVSLFFDSKDGAQLLTLTGRDIIWDYSLSEWRNHPLFGYGPRFLDFDHRSSIGLANATHAHNQFIDLLARSGLVGLLSVLPYLIAIVFFIYKSDQTNRELLVIAFLIVINRSISEVPLSLYGYGHEFLIQMFMVVAVMLSFREQSMLIKK